MKGLSRIYVDVDLLTNKVLSVLLTVKIFLLFLIFSVYNIKLSNLQRLKGIKSFSFVCN